MEQIVFRLGHLLDTGRSIEKGVYLKIALRRGRLLDTRRLMRVGVTLIL